MKQLKVSTITQPAIAVRSRLEAMGRIADLFAAVPSHREIGEDESRNRGTLFPFLRGFLEILDPVAEGHKRQQFINKFGPGLFMFSADLENEGIENIRSLIQSINKRIIFEGHSMHTTPEDSLRPYSWHVHPADSYNLYLSLAIRPDRNDNSVWAGRSYREYIPCNTRFLSEIRGVIARTKNPEAESAAFTQLGFAMRPLGGGAWGWQGSSGDVLELWPADSWQGDAVERRRDYAIVIRASAKEALMKRMCYGGHAFSSGAGRVLSSVDRVLGIRFAIE
jgi:hypothetical protein